MTPTFVPQATRFVEYTPSPDILPFQYCTFYIDTDTTVSIVDKAGNVSLLVSLKAGYHPILVQKITACTAGKVYYMAHDALR